MRGLYIHIPFCKSKCNYCGFYSVTNLCENTVGKYFKALLQDIGDYENLYFDTIYIGGGTPTVISAKILNDFFEKLFGIIEFSNKEFTVEANPESLNEKHLKVFNNYKVNRISLGVQSTDKNVLKFLGRIHEPQDVDISLNSIERLMPDCQVNLDFIYDIPEIPVELQKRSLQGILHYEPHHISAYSYSFDTDFLKEYSGRDISEELFLFVKDKLTNKGYKHYEVSNFAKKGCESRHNKIYWMMKEYAGIGAAAHSMIINENGKRIRFEKPDNVSKYIKKPQVKINLTEISFNEMFKEEIVFGLRMLDGINIENLTAKYGKSVEKFLYYCKTMTDEGFLQKEGENICVTEKGLLLLESLSEYFWSLEL